MVVAWFLIALYVIVVLAWTGWVTGFWDRWADRRFRQRLRTYLRQRPWRT